MSSAIRSLFATAILLLATTVNAQLDTDAGPIVYGHHHINATDLAEHKRFWVDTLGGAPLSFGSSEVISFPGVLVFLREQAATGGTKGTTVNHIGFTVPDLGELLARMAAAGYPDVTRAEVPASYQVEEGIAYNEVQDAYLAFIMAPDDVKIEFIEDKSQRSAAKLHHIHFATQKVDDMKAWYVDTFAAVPGMRGNFEAADLPGVNLTYSPSDEALAATKGRGLDHIGFEVQGLQAFCEALAARGIEFDVPYRELEGRDLAIAFFTDPFGTYIELTEGLDNIR